MSLSPRAWQLIAENRIAEAIREGQFDNLPGLGKPLEFDPRDDGDHWWLRAKARRESLSLLPPALELARIVERRLEAIGLLETEVQVVAALAGLNRFIDRANRGILHGPPSRVTPLDIDSILQRWRERRQDAPGTAD